MFTFIVGCGRSGTTLLRAMLDSHGSLAIPPESYFVVPALRTTQGQLTPVQVGRLLDTILAFPSFAEWQLPADRVRAQVLAAPPTSASGVVRELYSIYAGEQGKQHYGDKTPYHVLHIGLLASAFPDARFVHLLRDGRDVASSLVQSHFGPENLAEGFLFWRRHVESGLAQGRALPSERYLEVRYEDLVAAPDDTLGRLTRFLDLDYDHAMLSYHERAEELLGGMRRADHLQGIHRPVGPVKDWRTHMAPDDVVLFDLLAGDLAADLGYERRPGTATARHRLRAGGWRGRDFVLRAVAFLRARRAQRRRTIQVTDG